MDIHNLTIIPIIGIASYFFTKIINNIFSYDKFNNNKITPLSCPHKFIINYNNEEDYRDNTDDDNSTTEDINDIYRSLYEDSDEIEENESLVINNESLVINNESLVINNESLVINNESLVINNEINIFISTNYNTEITKTNNPFYKNLKVNYELIFEKNNLMEFKKSSKHIIDSFMNDDDMIRVEYSDDYNTGIYVDYKNATILIPENWDIIIENQNYIKFLVKDNNIINFIDKLKLLLEIYNNNNNNINFIFNSDKININSNNYLVFKDYIDIFDDDETIYKLLNIRDLYAFLNKNTNILDYNNVNFEELEDLRTYYNDNKNKLHELDDNIERLLFTTI
jgi:hypothetical protein